MIRLTIAVAVTILAVLAAPAAAEKAVKAKTATDGAAAGIDWFDGTVDEAFAAAARDDKPIYLYWGAEWCPPCHAINNTVFKSPAFIERSRLFVPVYLDGDTPNAQAAGERFDVLGYPTMIVFDSAGEELTRIPGGIDVQAYANVLDLTLASTTPVAATLDALMAGGGQLDAGECTQLAYYSWGQKPAVLEEYGAAAAFRRMYEACPAGRASDRSILYLNWLSAELDAREAAAGEGDEPQALPEAARAEVRQALNRVLADPQLVRDNVHALMFDGARYVGAVTEPGSPERAQLTRRFLAAYDDVFADEDVYLRERLYTLEGRIHFERIDDEDAELSPALQADIAAAVAWADENTPDPYARQPIINAAANVLEDAGMDDAAKKLLLREVGISGQPYYYMPTLADIEQRAGNDAAALEWLQKGWETSSGPATRFQWGSYYLNGLLEMSPKDVATIESVTVALVDEVLASGGFYQRPKLQLERLGEKLREWSESNDAEPALENIRDAVAAACGRDAESASRAACESFLEAA